MLRVRNFLSDESGVTAIEYALIALLVAFAGLQAYLVCGAKGI